MKAAILTISLLIATAATAADITVPLGSVTVPSLAVQDVLAWLDTQPDLYTYTTVEEVRTDPNTGEQVTITRQVAVKVPETPQAKLSRIMRAQAIAQTRAGVKQVRQAREDALAAAAVEAEPDPIASE